MFKNFETIITHITTFFSMTSMIQNFNTNLDRMSAKVEQIVRVKPRVGQVGSSAQMSLVNSRRTPLHDGQVPPTVHPFGITIDEHGLCGDIGAGDSCSWKITDFGRGQKQHCSPGEHLQSSLRCSCGQRPVHAKV